MKCRICAIKSPKVKKKSQHEIGGRDVPSRFNKRYGRICPECMPVIAKVFNNLPTSLEWGHSNELTMIEIIEEELKPRVWDDLKLLCEVHKHEGNCLNILNYIESRGTDGPGTKTERLYIRRDAVGNFKYEAGSIGRFENEGFTGDPG